MIGTTLSHFRITAKLGEGGMGEVYLAEDSKLGREVAIKVLPEAVASDPERLARFEREARVLASLNHPNIAGIHQTEEADGKLLLIMELVEGEDLAQRLARGPLTVEEALPIAKQITEALEAAHERGIVHRDLKPANIKVDAEGQVKVLDFGLAKALEPDTDTGTDPTEIPSPQALSLSPTLTQGMTAAGVILGTAAYMSPEQAKGRAVDKRADIWAFGVVLFEMLVGRKLFEAESVPETLGALFQQEIDLDDLPAGTPRRLRRLLDRCLDRDPKSRLRDIGEARLAIQSTIDGDDTDSTDTPPTPATRGTSVLFLAATLVAGLLVGSLLTWQLRPSPENQVLKLEVPTDNLRATRVQHPVISPDGKKVLVPEAQGLMIRKLDAMSGRWISDSTGARFPCWSPDSQSIAFVVGIEIRKASGEGGASTPVARLPADVGGSGGMVWTQDDYLLVAGGDRSGVMQVSVQGGEFKENLPLDKEQEIDFHEITLLPNKQDFVYIMHREDPSAEKRLVDSIGVSTNGIRKEVLRLEGESIVSLAYSPPGFLLFHQSTSTPGVWALPFSLKKTEAIGEPFLVVANSWLPSASDNGTLLLVDGLTESLSEVVELDRQGNLLRTIAQIQSEGETPHLSPDNSRLTLTALDSGNWDIWIYDLERDTRARLTFDSTFEAWGRWSPNGEEIMYSVADMRLVKIRRVDGMGEARIVGTGLAPDWIPDGSGFVFAHFSDDTDSWDVSYKFFDEDEAVPLLATPANESSPTISPDGRYLLYVSDETGNREILARSFPDGEKKWQISTAGGLQPRWSPNGREIFYAEGASLMGVEVVDTESFTLGRPTQILDGQLSLSVFDSSGFSTYTPGPGGQTLFLVRSVADADSPSRLMLIQNWYEEFARSGV